MCMNTKYAPKAKVAGEGKYKGRFFYIPPQSLPEKSRGHANVLQQSSREEAQATSVSQVGSKTMFVFEGIPMT